MTSSQHAGGAAVRVAAFGTEAVLVVRRVAAVAAAEAVLHEELDAVDRACSRFRPDAEITILYEHPGRWVPVSALLLELLRVARDVAERTEGAVDPTVCLAVEQLGYDRDFAALASDGPPLAPPVAAPGWQLLELDVSEARARLPGHVRLDLGSSAKAVTADRVAARVAALDTGVVVSIGGDVSIAGPAPADGWRIGIAAASDAPHGTVDEVVALGSGGLASSSTRLRSWQRGDRRVHHIVDPRTGDCASTHWQLVSVAAGSCVDANAASTAAVVWGEAAPRRLRALGLPARLVRHDGVVVTTSGWPSPVASASASASASAPAEAGA